LLAGVLATVVVLAVNAAMSARSPAPARQLAEQSYLDQVLPSVQDSAREGRDIADLRSQALSVSVSTVTGRINQVAAEAQQTLAGMQRLSPPKSMQTAHDLLVAALAIRVQGVQALSQVMGDVMSGHHDSNASNNAGSNNAGSNNALLGVGQDFVAADRAYELFVKSMPPAVGPPLPGSQWVTDPNDYSAPTVAVFLAALKSAASAVPVHDTAVVVVMTDPAPVSRNGDVQIMPIAKALNLQIVVGNEGNQTESNLTVSATISPSGYGASQMVRDFVSLSPGQRRTVQLGGLRPVPGQQSMLLVKIDNSVTETNIANNSKALTFIMQ
jgi:hypothetical protein